MADRLQILIAQRNPTTGDLRRNLDESKAALAEAEAQGADLAVLPEMFLSGYQLQDLVRKPAFGRACAEALAELAAATRPGGPGLLVGAPLHEGGKVYNALFLCAEGAVQRVFRKRERPNYGVFDEKRTLDAGPLPEPAAFRGVNLGVMICEDAWEPDCAAALAAAGAEILIVANGSPYERGKHEGARMADLRERTAETGLPLLYVNMVGGQDDQIFDGGSFALNPDGARPVQAPFFAAADALTLWRREAGGWRCEPGVQTPTPPDYEADYQAICLGLGDYMRKSGFKQALLGLSGGIDSALVAAIAADVLGPENVWCLMLPSRFTSRTSLEDAEETARLIGAKLDSLSIAGAVSATEQALAPFFAGTQPGLTEENVQPRLRGLYLMALSNKFGPLLLTTGNKSEVAVGYATLYGDMAGGYNPLIDLYKTRVFETCRWRNANHRPWMKGNAGAVIPERVISKPPTAELRENQKDSDSLPEYPVLDAILERLIEGDESVAEVVAAGFDRETVRKVERLIYLAEYKRFQAAPGAKVTRKALWLDRRYPIVNRFRDLS